MLAFSLGRICTFVSYLHLLILYLHFLATASQIYSPLPPLTSSSSTSLFSRFTSTLSLFRAHKPLNNSQSQLAKEEMSGGGGGRPLRANRQIPSSSIRYKQKEKERGISRMRDIEQQVGNLAGALEFSAVSVCGSSRLTTSFRKLTVNFSLLPIYENSLVQVLLAGPPSHHASMATGLNSMASIDRSIEARCSTKVPTSTTTNNSIEWFLMCRLASSKSKSALHPLNDLGSNLSLDMNDTWKFTNRKHIFSLEPYSYLKITVSIILIFRF